MMVIPFVLKRVDPSPRLGKAPIAGLKGEESLVTSRLPWSVYSFLLLMVVQGLVEVRHGYAGCHHAVEVMGESGFICAAEDVGLELEAAGQTDSLSEVGAALGERVVELHRHAGWRLDGRWTWGPERFFRLSA